MTSPHQQITKRTVNPRSCYRQTIIEGAKLVVATGRAELDQLTNLCARVKRYPHWHWPPPFLFVLGAFQSGLVYLWQLQERHQIAPPALSAIGWFLGFSALMCYLASRPPKQ